MASGRLGTMGSLIVSCNTTKWERFDGPAGLSQLIFLPFFVLLPAGKEGSCREPMSTSTLFYYVQFNSYLTWLNQAQRSFHHNKLLNYVLASF